MDKFDIYTLLLKEHYEQITDQERQELEDILQKDPEARAMQSQVKAMPKEQVNELLSKLDVEESLNIVKQRAVVTRRKMKVQRWVAAAGLIPVILIAGYFLLIKKDTSNASLAQYSNGLTLKLASGQQIVLQDTGIQKITAGNTTLYNTARVLRLDGENNSTGWNTLTVPPKLDYKVILADGSEVWLNSVSSIRFPLSFLADKREVYMDGEAYFKIAANSSKPFIVHIKGAEIKVLGTEFNINAYRTGTIITSLVNGKVQVYNAGKTIELNPGKEAILTESTGATTVQDFDSFTTLSWQKGFYYFEDAPLSEIAEMIRRTYNVQVVMDNSTIGKLVLRGKFDRNQPVQDLMDLLNNTGRVALYWKDGTIHCK